MYGLALTSLVLAIITIFQSVALPKPITGCLVNAGFVLVVRRAGLAYGLLLGITTPLLALLTGILPAPLLPLVIPITLGNALFIYLYEKLMKKPLIARLLLPPLGKWLTIALTANLVLRLFGFGDELNAVVLLIITIQAFTALGGILIGEFLDRRIPHKREHGSPLSE